MAMAEVTSTTAVEGHEEDIGNLVGDSFSDMPSDDSGSWMNKVDVSNFKQLCNPPPVSTPASLLDHGGYAVTTTYPSPDSGDSPPSKKDRTSFGSVENTKDFSADPQPPPAPPPEITRVGMPASVGLVSSSGAGCWPKPSFSYSCLIALALKNSKAGRLTVAEIYGFMCENFPYFRNAPAGWKNSVRHNLSLNKCFEKIEVETPGGHGRKSCLWTMNPAKVGKMENEVRKCREKDPQGVIESLANPMNEEMELLEKGLKGMPGEVSAFFTPDVPTSTQSMLLLRPAGPSTGAQYPPYQHQMLLLRPAGPSTGAQYPPYQHQAWTGTASPVQPKTPPRAPNAPHPTSPRIGLPGHFSTPTSQARRSHAPMHQSQGSPFGQTGAYSPGVQSPQVQVAGRSADGHLPPVAQPPPQATTHWPPNPATPQPGLLSLHSPYGTASSGFGSGGSSGGGEPWGCLSPCRLTPYDTAANALNNNSLLQSALAQSPCRGPVGPLLTLQSL